MKQFLALMTMVVIFASTLAACHTDPISSESTEITQATEFVPVGKEGLNGKKIIFIGNSYTYYGKCVLDKAQDAYTQADRTNDKGYFYQLCKANGIDIDVTNFTFGSHQLKDFYSGSCAANRGHNGLDHFSYLTDMNYDYVVIQANSKTVDILGECQTIFQRFQEANPDVKLILLVPHLTHLNNYPHRSDIKKVAAAGILVVDWGTLVCDIINGDTKVPGATQEYDYNSFIISKSETDGYHQNMLSGYITALMAYCAITGESAQGQPWSFEDDPHFSTMAITEYRLKYYSYNFNTNFDTILDSEADMTGIQQLVDQYLVSKTYLNY